MSTNSVLFDRAVKHSVFLERLKVGQVRRVTEQLEQTLKEVKGTLETRLKTVKIAGFDTGPATTKRLKDLFVATDAQLTTGYAVLKDKFGVDLNKLAVNEASFQAALLKETVPIDFDFVTPSPATLRSLVTTRPFQGKLLKGWFDTLENSTKDAVKAEVTQGVIQGESIPAIARRMQNVTGTSLRQATAVTRTAVNHVSTHAREQVYADNDELIKGVQYVSTLDNRTTEICISLDGRVFNVNEGPRPPQHMQCRSTTVPVVKSLTELGLSDTDFSESTRASMNGQVPERTTYPEWLKKQPASVQNEVLGRGKAELFRSGKLKLSKFNGVGNRALTVDQLKAKEIVKARPKVKAKVKTGPKVGVRQEGESHADFVKRFKQDTKNLPILDKIARAKHLDARMQKMVDIAGTKDVQLIDDAATKLRKEFDPSKLPKKQSAEFNRARLELKRSSSVLERGRNNIRDFLSSEVDGKTVFLRRKTLKPLGQPIDPKYLKRKLEAENWYSNTIARGDDFDDIRINSNQLRAGNRAHARPTTDSVFVAVDEAVDTHVHEIGHLLEYKGDVNNTALKFRQDRVNKSSFERTRTRTFDKVIHKGYGDSEFGRIDEFDKAFGNDGWYVGKSYDLGKAVKGIRKESTEIISMGMEKMWKNPVQFIKADPEYAKFILGIMDGSLR